MTAATDVVTMDLSLASADLLGAGSLDDTGPGLPRVAPAADPDHPLSATCEPDEAIAHLQHLRETYDVSLASLTTLVGCAQSTMVALLYPSSAQRRVRITRRLHEAVLDADFDLDQLEAAALITGCGTRRRLQALGTLGWSVANLATHLECSAAMVSRLRRAKHVSVGNARAVRAVYEQLSMHPAPNAPSHNLTREQARSQGWHSPLAWDDDTIDAPTAQPAGDSEASRRGVDDVARRRVVLDQAQVLGLPAEEQREIAGQARDRGVPARQVAECLGVSLRTVQRWDASRTPTHLQEAC